jgi:quercetin dioxygenase-like cupin family protein
LFRKVLFKKVLPQQTSSPLPWFFLLSSPKAICCCPLFLLLPLLFIPTPCATIAAAALYQPGRPPATTAEGYKSTLFAVGRFGEINVSSSSPHHSKEERNEQIWFSLQQTKGPSDLYIQNNVWQPGGSTGWHTHPGHSLIIVTEGTVTEYMSDDPECKPHVYTQGMGLVDPGGNHVHLIKNEGTVPAVTIAVQLIPSGTERRIDAAQPTNCHL